MPTYSFRCEFCRYTFVIERAEGDLVTETIFNAPEDDESHRRDHTGSERCYGNFHRVHANKASE